MRYHQQSAHNFEQNVHHFEMVLVVLYYEQIDCSFSSLMLKIYLPRIDQLQY